nr:unnamed protein product [Spirometra erinaceieuropaei]
MERIIKRELMRLLDQRHLLCDAQHGFRRERSCLTNLHYRLEQWTRATDEGNVVHVAYIDFKKAFNSVSHQRFLYKLNRIGVRGKLLKWTENFLIGRSHTVRLGGKQSAEVTATSGVPQGSVLGPILFLIYIDDCTHGLDCDIAMFADDIKLWTVIRNKDDEANLQSNFGRLEQWLGYWLLQFNVTKCNILRIGRTSSAHRQTYYLNNTPPSLVPSNAAKKNSPPKQKVQQASQQKQTVQPSECTLAAATPTDSQEPASTSAVTATTTKSKTTGHALGVMRMDDPAHLKKSIKQLHRKNLHPRPQEPVRVNLFSHLSQPDKHVDVLGELSLGHQASIHPAFISLGIDIDEGRIWGSNRRCLEFLRATVALINSYAWSEHTGDVPATGSLSRSFVTVLFNELSDPDDIWRGPRGIQADWEKGLPGYSLSDAWQPDKDESEACLGDSLQTQCSLTNPPRLSDWRTKKTLRLLNLAYDVLPPELVTAVVTELGILPTTSVPVVLRVTQSAPDAEVVN